MKRRQLIVLSATASTIAVVAGIVIADNTPSIDQLRERGAREGWTFTVGATKAFLRNGANMNGIVEPKDWQKNAMFVTPAADRALPSKLDWRDLAVDGLSPIKNQGSCGSCWAFSAVATMEDQLRIRDNTSKDLSEQYLVSCNQDGYSCSGGWWAHKYHVNPGSVLENDFRYTAQNTPCKSNLPKDAKLEGWAYVTQHADIPSVENLKRAIMEYGPISVTVHSNSSFHAYTGGIYNDCSNAGSVNHAVNIVGWNDEGGYWIMRNSWGRNWGENGYMRIKYNCRRLGYAASFVTYAATCQPQPVANTGTDVTISAGEEITLGDEAVAGTSYQWEPAVGLDNPQAAQVTASPTKTTTYTLTATTSCGSARRAVTVTVAN